MTDNIVQFPSPDAPCDTETDDRLDAMAAAMAGEAEPEFAADDKLTYSRSNQMQLEIGALQNLTAAFRQMLETFGTIDTIVHVRAELDGLERAFKKGE